MPGASPSLTSRCFPYFRVLASELQRICTSTNSPIKPVDADRAGGIFAMLAPSL